MEKNRRPEKGSEEMEENGSDGKMERRDRWVYWILRGLWHLLACLCFLTIFVTLLYCGTL